jgi:hypothetical protein
VNGNLTQKLIKMQAKTLPDFKCSTCGNCEIDFHIKNQWLNGVLIKDDSKKEVGFCLRFKENTPLNQKNLTCWTSKVNEHYRDLHLFGNNKKTALTHVVKAQAQQMSINFDNQINPFE